MSVAYPGPLNGCNVGDAEQAVQYANERLLPVLNEAMAAVCLEKPFNPLHAIQKTLRANSELRAVRTYDVHVDMPPLVVPPVAPLGVQPAAPQANQHRRTATTTEQAPSSTPAVTKTPVDLHFESRPCLLTKPKDHDISSGELASGPPPTTTPSSPSLSQPPLPAVYSTAPLPRTFQKCGDYPVYQSEIPTRSMLQSIARVVREYEASSSTTSLERITWVVVSTEATILTFFGEQPHKARLPEAAWGQLLRDATRAGHFTRGPIDGANEFSVTPKPTPRISSKALNNKSTPRSNSIAAASSAGGSSSSQPQQQQQQQESTPPHQRLPVDDALLEQLFVNEIVTAAGRKGNAQGVCDALRLMFASSSSSTATNFASAKASSGGADRDVDSSSSAAAGGGAASTPKSSGGTSSLPAVQHDLIRLFHPSNVAVAKPFVDMIWAMLNQITLAHPKTVFVVLSVDQCPLMRHISTLMCLYFRTKSDVAAWRNILNATERLRDRNYVYDFEKIDEELAAARSKRDEMRKMLREAHVTQLQETGLMHTASSFNEQWETTFSWHHRRREQEDERRNKLNIIQGTDAAVRVQSIMRGMITRRRTNGVLKKVKKELKDFEGPYRRGRYPMVDATMEYLQYVFGPQMITSELMKRGTTKTATRWKRSKLRVPPQDECDISSEEEQWEEESFERLINEGTGAINPLHMVDLCMGATRSLDKDVLFDAFINYSGVSMVQERAMQAMERLVHYMMVCVYWSARHRVREGMSSDAGAYASTNLLNMPPKLKSCDTYVQFTAVYRRPQEWINHPQFSLLLLTNVPEPLQRHRLMVANSQAPNGSSVEGISRSDLLMPQAPIFLVPEGLTTDQWVESLSFIQRTSYRCKKVLWLSSSPDFCVYVNGVPVHFVDRQKGAIYSSGAAAAAQVSPPLVAAVINASSSKESKSSAVLTNSDEVLVETSDALVGGVGHAKRDAGAKPKSLSPFGVPAACVTPPAGSLTSQAAPPPSDPSRRSPSVSHLSVTSLNSPSVRRMSSDSAASPAASSLSTRRQSSIITETGPVTLKKYESGWYGISWDNVETALVDDLIQRIDDPKADGVLRCFSVSTLNERLNVHCPMIWEQHCLQLKRFSSPKIDVFDIRVTQQPAPTTGGHTHSRSSRSSSQFVTPRLSVANTTTTTTTTTTSSAMITGATTETSRSTGSLPSPESVSIRRTERSGGASRRNGNSSMSARRGSMNSRRSSDVGSSTNEEPQQPLDLLLPPAFPVHARDALRTPLQAAEDVREKLRASSAADFSFLYRRLPLVYPLQDEWLKNLDMIISSFKDHLLDINASIAVCVGSVDSVWISLFAAILWEVEAKAVAPRKPLSNASGTLLGSPQRQLKSPPIAASSVTSVLEHPIVSPEATQTFSPLDGAGGAATAAAAVAGGGVDQSFSVTPSRPSTVIETTNVPAALRPLPLSSILTDAQLTEPMIMFPVLRVVGEEIPQLRMEPAVRGVMQVLYQTETKTAMFDSVLVAMEQAKSAAATKDWQDCKRHCLEAVTAFQRFAVLVIFHCFLLYQIQDATNQSNQTLKERLSQHKANSHKNQSQSFRDFVLNTAGLYTRLLHINPWEKNLHACPLGEQSWSSSVVASQSNGGIPACLDGDHRWRLDVLMPRFS